MRGPSEQGWRALRRTVAKLPHRIAVSAPKPLGVTVCFWVLTPALPRALLVLSNGFCRLEHVYLRGNQVRFVVLPEILKNAPLFK